MTSTEQLHYAMGQLAYAMAAIDGKVQPEERQKFHDIVVAELKGRHYDFSVSDIIFQILDKDRIDPDTAYDWAMSQFHLHSHYLDPELKRAFIRIAEVITQAFPPVTPREERLLDRFRMDIAPLHGDPAYYYA